MYNFVNIYKDSDIFNNFWTLNPQIKLIEPFNKVFNLDNGDDASSKLMWAIWLFSDPNYINKLGKQPYELKLKAVKIFCEDFDQNDPLISECLKVYPDRCLSPAARAFKMEEESLQNRNEIFKQNYTFDEVITDMNGNPVISKTGIVQIIPGNSSKLDTMRKNSKSIYDQYSQIRQLFEEEAREAKVFGGGETSIIESGELLTLDEGETDIEIIE